jgi:hypothetical protein
VAESAEFPDAAALSLIPALDASDEALSSFE